MSILFALAILFHFRILRVTILAPPTLIAWHTSC